MLKDDDCDEDGVISKEEFIGICYKIQGRIDEYDAQHRKLKMEHIASSLHISAKVSLDIKHFRSVYNSSDSAVLNVLINWSLVYINCSITRTV